MTATSEMTPLVIGIALVALLTAGGMAVRSVSRIWLRHWAERRLHGADAALVFLEGPHRLLGASSVAVSLVVVLMGVSLGARPHVSSWRLAGAVGVVLLALLLVGQIAARAVARRWAATLVPATLPLLRAAQLLAWPVMEIGRRAASPFGSGATLRADPLQALLREGELEGIGERDEIAIITGVVEFGEKRVGAVMTPRDRIFALDVALPPDAMATAIASSAYSRVPLYRDSIDDSVGMVHAFDVLKAAGQQRPPMRPIAEATLETRCSDLLFRMLRGRRHLSLVRDENRRVLGLVTLEDLLEELVGEIRDEHDDHEDAESLHAVPASSRAPKA